MHSIDLKDPAATDRFGACLGRLLRPGDIVALDGPLGAGKSSLARAAIRERLGDPDADVPSPTFTLVQTYEMPDLEIWHVDLYRLDDAADAEELGLMEAFSDAASLIEWPGRLGRAFPHRALRLTIEIVGEGRRIGIAAPDDWHDRVGELTGD